MVHIIKKDWKRKTSFYIYDNKWDDKKNKYKKVYLGIATEDEYEQYKIDLKRKLKNPNYCSKCGGRIPITLPEYMRHRVKLCQCQNTENSK